MVDVHFPRLLRNVIWIFDSFRVVTWLRYYDFVVLSFERRFYSDKFV